MGNATSMTGKSKKSLEHIVNYIAAQYIRKQNFKELSNLSNQEYCNDLVILTSKIIKEHLDEDTIKYLALKKGIAGNNIIKADNVIAIDKKKLDSLDVKNPIKKERLCIGVAKHYIQVAHIFAAISSTLNPQYTYRGVSGETIETPLTNKEDIPGEAETKITRNNLCSNRLKILLGNIDYNDINSMSEIKLNPKFCALNKDKTLSDEPGIPELKQLYLDKYDYGSGKFTEMTPEMEKIYQKDVETLYKAFSGNTKIPTDKETGEPTITRFSKIPLKDFYNSEGCTNEKFNQPVTGTLKDSLFKEYADNIKHIMVTIKTYNGELLEILDKLFVFGINPETKDKQIVINPKLTDNKLKELTSETRNIIIKLYTFCEDSFLKGLEIYEAIVKKQKLDTTKLQIDNLHSALQKDVPEIEQVGLQPSPLSPSVPVKSIEAHQVNIEEPDNMASRAKDAVGEAAEHTQAAIDNTKEVVDNTKEAVSNAVSNAMENTKVAVNNAVENTKDVVDNAMENTKEVVGNAVENTKDVVGNAVENTKVAVGNAVENTDAAIHQAASAAVDDINKAKASAINVTEEVKKEGEQLTHTVKEVLPSSPRSITAKFGGKKKKRITQKKKKKNKNKKKK